MNRLLSALTTAVLVLGTGMAVLAFVLPASSGPPAPAGYTSLRAADPVRLVVHKLGIDAPVVPITLADDGVLETPGAVSDVGWWDGSAEPGQEHGQTVITGHTVHTGGGALDPLPRLKRGDHLDVVTNAGTMRYVVQDAVVATHEDIATYSQGIFGQDRTFPGGARLVLVTCSDYNGSYWTKNLVVFAKPLGEPTQLTQHRSGHHRADHHRAASLAS